MGTDTRVVIINNCHAALFFKINICGFKTVDTAGQAAGSY